MQINIFMLNKICIVCIYTHTHTHTHYTISRNSNFKVNAHILNFADINQRISGQREWGGEGAGKRGGKSGVEEKDLYGKGWGVGWLVRKEEG